MGSRAGESVGALALLLGVGATLTSWLGAFLSVILLVRGVLPSIKLRAGRASGSAAEQQRQQVPAAGEQPAVGHAAGLAGEGSPAEQAAPPGYNRGVEQLRRSEFSRLQGRVYADYAGAAPHSERLLAEALRELSSSLHGNPHSEAGWAPENRSAAADAARLATLRWCNADPEQYCCIFTAGATAGLKLVGESFPWGPASAFVHLRDNHTSVLGIRQLAAQHGAACPAAAVEVAAVPTSGGQPKQSSAWRLAPCSKAAAASMGAAAAQATSAAAQASSEAQCSSAEEPQHLFALPLESNFSGVHYTQRLVPAVQSGGVQWVSEGSRSSGDSAGADPAPGSSDSSCSSSSGSGAQPLPAGRWRVLLDAAKGAASCPPDLSRFPADFVALSYYKAFGWPTGLGALLVRRDALPCLRRRYFGGGTVEVALADESFHRLRSGPAGWEDGTTSFLDLPAVAAGFRFIERLGGFPAVAAHATAVASSLATQLAALRHWNGAPVCTLYGAHAALSQQQGQRQQGQQQQQLEERGASMSGQQPPTLPLPQAVPLPPGVEGQGPVVTFNLRRADGSLVGYREVERLASLCGIMLRTGCCCNPGACAAALGLSAADMRTNWESGHVCWDGRDVIGGRPTGAVRASFGYASSLADAQAIVALVQRFFVEQRPAEAAGQGAAPGGRAAPAEDAAAAAGSCAAGSAALAAAAGVGAAAGAPPLASAAPAVQQAEARIGALWVYPIKSCRGFSPAAWPLGPAGLLYDRCWALVDPSGSALRMKRHPALASIAARVDLQRGLLVVTAAGGEQPLEVPLPEGSGAAVLPCYGSGSGSSSSDVNTGSPGSPGSTHSASSSTTNPEPFSVRVCSRTAWVQRSAAASGSDAAAAAWFSRVLGTPCHLVQQAAGPCGSSQPAGGAMASSGTAPEAGFAAEAADDAAAKAEAVAAAAVEEEAEAPTELKAGRGSRSFANEGHLLVVGAASLADLASRAGSSEAPEVFAQRFRPNLVVEGCSAYAEDSWRSVNLVPAADRASRAAGSSAGACAAASSASVDCSSSGRAMQLRSAGPCTRCDVVCIDPLTGRRSGPEPLLALAGYRRSRGRIDFGQLMNVQQAQGQQQQQQSAGAKQPDGCACACRQGGGEAGAAALPAWVAVGDGLAAALHA